MRFLRPLWISAAFVAALNVPAHGQAGLVVRRLGFAGNRAIDGYTLSTVIATTVSSTFARSRLLRWIGLGEKRYLDEVEFKRDVVRLLLFYRQSGYMGAVIDTSVRRTAKDVFITFRIHEGDPVRVRQFALTGFDGIYNIERRRDDLPLHVGDPFNRFLFQASADTLLVWLHDLGYPYAEVFRSFDASAGLLEADVGLEAVAGPRVRVSQVDIEGLRKLDTGAVRNMLSVRPGDILSRSLLYQSQRDLYAMGVFRSASVALADSMPRGPGDTLARVLVSAVEGPRHRVRTGVGYATLECFRVQAGWTVVDFLGGARALDVSGRAAKLGVGHPFDAGFRKNICKYLEGDFASDTLTYNLSATLRQPVFLSPRHNANVGVFAERRSEFKAYQRDAIGLNVGATFNARRTVPVTLNYGYSVGRTQAQDAVYCSVFSACTQADREALRQRRAFAAVTLTGVRDQTNSPFDPTRGSVVTLTLTHASRLVGSDSGYKFNRAELEVSRFHPLGRRTVFAWRLKAGAILPETFATTGQAARYVPPDQRFYAGGPNTVRGFRLNDLGPRVYVTTDTTLFDPTAAARGDTIYTLLRTFATGGNSVFLANGELRFASPLWPQWVRLGAFVDVGQMYERQGGFVSFDAVRVTPGVGVRVTTPLGPVRLDVAYNGYARESGPLFYQAGDTLTQIRTTYPSRGFVPRRFVDRLVFQFAIGQAY